MLTRLTLCILAFAVALSTPALAHRHGTLTPPMHKEQCMENKQWMQEHMFPVLLQWKQELDALLAPEDLEQLNQLRARAAELRAQKNSIHEALRAAREENTMPTRDEIRDQFAELREQRHKLMEDLRPLAEKYEEQLQALHEQHRPTLEAWKKELKEQRQQRLSDDNKGAERPQGRHPRCSAKRGYRNHHRGAQFLLWDGSPFVEQSESLPSAPTNEYNKATGEQASATPVLVQLSPNPAAAQVALQFSLPQAGATTLTVYDIQGNVVATPLQKQYFQAGVHNVEIATKTLPSGVYSYTLENNGAALTGTFRVVR